MGDERLCVGVDGGGGALGGDLIAQACAAGVTPASLWGNKS